MGIFALNIFRDRCGPLGAGLEALSTARITPPAAALVIFGVAASFFLDRTEGEVASAIGAAALLSSVAGFAFPAISGSLLFHLSPDTVRLVQLMMTCGIANQAAMTWSVRAHIAWRKLRRCLIGGIAGLPIGVYLLHHVDRRQYVVALGAFLTAYGMAMLLKRPYAIRSELPALDIVAGFLGGVTGGLAAFPGAFLTIWSSMQGLSKHRQRGLYQPYILTMQCVALVSISLSGRHGSVATGYDCHDLLFVPFGLLGTCLGMSLYRKLSDWHFRLAVNILLIVSGISYFA